MLDNLQCEISKFVLEAVLFESKQLPYSFLGFSLSKRAEHFCQLALWCSQLCLWTLDLLSALRKKYVKNIHLIFNLKFSIVLFVPFLNPINFFCSQHNVRCKVFFIPGKVKNYSNTRIFFKTFPFMLSYKIVFLFISHFYFLYVTKCQN